MQPRSSGARGYVGIYDSTITMQAFAGIAATGDGSVTVTAVRNKLQDNGTALLADGAGMRLILDANTATRNSVGVSRLNGAVVDTRGNNTVDANDTDTVGAPFSPLGGI